MIHVETVDGGIRLTRGDESFLITDAETPAFLANLIARLTGRSDYAEGYQNGLDEGYRRAGREWPRRAPAALETQNSKLSTFET